MTDHAVNKTHDFSKSNIPGNSNHLTLHRNFFKKAFKKGMLIHSNQGYSSSRSIAKEQSEENDHEGTKRLVNSTQARGSKFPSARTTVDTDELSLERMPYRRACLNSGCGIAVLYFTDTAGASPAKTGPSLLDAVLPSL